MCGSKGKSEIVFVKQVCRSSVLLDEVWLCAYSVECFCL